MLITLFQLSVLLSNELSSIHQILPNEMHDLDEPIVLTMIDRNRDDKVPSAPSRSIETVH
jgi:hypothetical protein